MKNLAEFVIGESKEDKSWNLWDYTENNVREILIWKNGGEAPEQSDVTEIDKEGISLMNTSFEEVKNYVESHKKDDIDKWHLDFSNANFDKIKDIF